MGIEAFRASMGSGSRVLRQIGWLGATTTNTPLPTVTTVTATRPVGVYNLTTAQALARLGTFIADAPTVQTVTQTVCQYNAASATDTDALLNMAADDALRTFAAEKGAAVPSGATRMYVTATEKSRLVELFKAALVGWVNALNANWINSGTNARAQVLFDGIALNSVPGC